MRVRVLRGWLLLAFLLLGTPVSNAAVDPGLATQGGARRALDQQPPVTRSTNFSLPEDSQWEGFVTPGLSSQFFTARFTEYHGKLVIWGDIDAAGSQAAGGVVLWDGLHFEPLPSIGSVGALTIWNDQIVAAASSGSRRAILRFNGAQWDTLGIPSSSVSGMTVFQGQLVAVGGFTSISGVPVFRVASFNGSTWSGFSSALPSTESPVTVVAHAGKLIVGMNISSLGFVRGWDPVAAAWQPLGAGLNSVVSGLASDGVKLYAAGQFSASGTTPMFGAAQWDGVTWSAFGLPSSGAVTSLTVWNGKAVVPIQFRPGVGRLKVWDGLALSTLPGDSLAFDGGFMTVSARGVGQVGSWGTKLVASGTFFRNGSTAVPGLAMYDGSQWSSIQEPWGPNMRGLFGPVTDMKVVAGRLIVSGPFGLAAAGDHFVIAPGVAAWDGTQWAALGEGLGGNDIFLGEYNGDLMAAGWRLYPRPGPAFSWIARWNGTSWAALGSVPLNVPTCMQQMHQDLYVGDEVTGLQRWNGSAWSEVGSGTTYALALSATGDTLVVGGSFVVGAENIGFWNGTSWLPAGAGVNSNVTAATLWNGRIVIGGSFTASGATPLAGAAVWDGAAWQPLGTSAVQIDRLRAINGELYASGTFRLPDNSTVFTVARYVAPDWQLLGSGANNTVFEAYQGYLYHGGSGIVHGHVAQNFSRRPLPAPVPVLSAPPSGANPIALSVGPNPVQKSARFSFTLGAPGRVRLTIVDLAGREVETLLDGPQSAGPHELTWSPRGAPGVYLARLQTNGTDRVVRFVRLDRP